MPYIFLATVFTFCCAVLLQASKSRSKETRSRQSSNFQLSPSYPHKEPFLGLDLILETVHLIGENRNIEALAERHRTIGTTYVTNSLGQKVFYTADSAVFESVYGSNWRSWGVEPARLSALEPFCGRGFITTDGAEWQAIHDLMAPAFDETNNSLVSAYFEEALNEVVLKIPTNGETVDLDDVLTNFLFDIAGEFLWGARVGTVSANQNNFPSVHAQKFLEAYHKGVEWLQIRVFFGVLGRNLPNRQFSRYCQALHSFVDGYISEELDQKSEGGKRAENSSLVACLAKKTNDRSKIRSQVIQCIMAMQDTTSTLITNTVFLLSRHPCIWAQLRAEIHDERNSGAPLEQIQLLQNILRESLRLYPIFCTSGRTSLHATSIPRGGGPDGSAPVFVPENSRIITVFYALHRNTAIFGANVESFKPERWDKIDPGPWDYLPFSNGPRRCTGQAKAMSEASYIIASLAKHFVRVESRDSRPWAGKWNLTVKNANGCQVAFFK